MRALMGLHKNEHGVYHVRRKVPKRLEAAVARVLNNGKQRQPWLSRSLHTGDVQKANVLAKPVMMEFDQIIAAAEASIAPRAVVPLRTSLTDAEIKQIADYHHATVLSTDGAVRREGWRDREDGTPTSGLSDEQLERLGRSQREALVDAKAALARGNIGHVKDEVADLLSDIFRIALDESGPTYRKLALAVLSAEVRAYEAIERRQRGEVVDTPRQPHPENASSTGETLTAALAGWKKERQRSPGTLTEYERAVSLDLLPLNVLAFG